MATTYSITYKFTGQSNTTMAKTSGTSRSVARTKFTLSGSTGVAVGRITKITFTHYNSCTESSCTCKMNATLSWSGGSCTSDTVSIRYAGSVKAMTNTFTSNLPPASMAKAWTSISQKLVSKTSVSADVYWRATSSQPMTVTIYFISEADLVTNADPPADVACAVSDALNLPAAWGGYVQNRSDLRFTGSYVLDARYPALTATSALELYRVTRLDEEGDDDETLIYSHTQASPAFTVGQLDAAGRVKWVYTVTDSGGHAVRVTGEIEQLAWSPPACALNAVTRYAEVLDAGGVTYEEAEDGPYVWLNLAASVTPLAGQNAWSLTLAYGPEGGTATAVAIASDADGGTYTLAENAATSAAGQTKISAAIPAGDAYVFTLTLTDALGGTASAALTLPRAGGYFNVEKNGVAVGMRSTGDAQGKRFEVAEDYEARFYGAMAVAAGGLLKVVALTTNVGNLAANGWLTYNLNPGQSAGDGWTALGLVGFHPSAGEMHIYRVLPNANGTFDVGLHNITSSAKTGVTLNTYWLCVRTV